MNGIILMKEQRKPKGHQKGQKRKKPWAKGAMVP